jgi:hypothetical protein
MRLPTALFAGLQQIKWDKATCASVFFGGEGLDGSSKNEMFFDRLDVPTMAWKGKHTNQLMP